MELAINDTVRWESAAGVLRGKIVNIKIAENALNEMIPWITVEHTVRSKNLGTHSTRTTLCGSHQGIAQLRICKAE